MAQAVGLGWQKACETGRSRSVFLRPPLRGGLADGILKLMAAESPRLVKQAGPRGIENARLHLPEAGDIPTTSPDRSAVGEACPTRRVGSGREENKNKLLRQRV